jgi:hypothetical protein
MIKFLRNLFRVGPDKLQAKSEKALDLFSQAIVSLKQVNEESGRERARLSQEILILNENVASLSSISINNEKVIKNIEKILN